MFALNVCPQWCAKHYGKGPQRVQRSLRPTVPAGSSQSGGEPAGSWVELHFSNNGHGSSVPASVAIYYGEIEKILLDAHHESGWSQEEKPALSLRKIMLREGKKF
uniref:Uncharacterized protein n=1 Tax=Equus caballus TaxID=9796 RepID=A0A3Q2LHL4_HORSE